MNPPAKMVLLFSIATAYACSSGENTEQSCTPVAAQASSGWADLNGSVVNYEYRGFAGFRLRFCGNTLHWQGYKGLFKDIAADVEPIISKVADDIYFLSWPTPDGGGDNVVVNFTSMMVFAHLGGDANFAPISGPVHCRDTTECQPPDRSATHPLAMMGHLVTNAWRAGFSGPGGAMEALKQPQQLPEAHLLGENELKGKFLGFETPSGFVELHVQGPNTSVQSGGDQTLSKTYATMVAEGIYFISWDGKPAGNHIVFNRHNMTVYDQIMPDGSRREAIYPATCFSDNRCESGHRRKH